jgi:hypothetical protein
LAKIHHSADAKTCLQFVGWLRGLQKMHDDRSIGNENDTITVFKDDTLAVDEVGSPEGGHKRLLPRSPGSLADPGRMQWPGK